MYLFIHFIAVLSFRLFWLWWARATLPCSTQASHGGVFSYCGAGAPGTQVSVLVLTLSCSKVCEISPDQGSNRVSCIGRWILNHWTTREVPWIFLEGGFSVPCISSFQSLGWTCVMNSSSPYMRSSMCWGHWRYSKKLTCQTDTNRKSVIPPQVHCGVVVPGFCHISHVILGTVPPSQSCSFPICKLFLKSNLHSISPGLNETPICMWKCLAEKKIKRDTREDIESIKVLLD